MSSELGISRIASRHQVPGASARTVTPVVPRETRETSAVSLLQRVRSPKGVPAISIMPFLWPVPDAPDQAPSGSPPLSTSKLLEDALALALRAFNVPRSDLDELQERARSWSFDSTSTTSDTSLYRGDAQADVFSWAAVRWRMQGLEEAFGLELIVLFALSGL